MTNKTCVICPSYSSKMKLSAEDHAEYHEVKAKQAGMWEGLAKGSFVACLGFLLLGIFTGNGSFVGFGVGGIFFIGMIGGLVSIETHPSSDHDLAAKQWRKRHTNDILNGKSSW